MKKDLVYVPSRALLSDQPQPESASRTKKIKNPGVFLVVSDLENKVGIFCEGAVWYVDSKDCFKVKEKK